MIWGGCQAAHLPTGLVRGVEAYQGTSERTCMVLGYLGVLEKTGWREGSRTLEVRPPLPPFFPPTGEPYCYSVCLSVCLSV